MSATRSQWAQIIEQVLSLRYEQDDSWLDWSYEDAKPHIMQQISNWTIIELDTYIKENFNLDDLHSITVRCAGTTTCARQL